MVVPTTCGCGLHCAPPRGAGSSTAGGRCQGRGGSSGGRCSAGVARATTGSPSYCAPGSSGGEVLCFCKTDNSLVKQKKFGGGFVFGKGGRKCFINNALNIV